ncbi:hypothetical protein GWI33_003896 [Rhynchophorus ferrugineus]|uniref:Uncharacterized protein n=1 Tax=Rhynchophorus ferrugineus TaxID=354439 RepID=A0A834IT54_RHYFE|nr:hypothetical protein GWI33_003896 [Rhynchophorus ferrugineus]
MSLGERLLCICVLIICLICCITLLIQKEELLPEDHLFDPGIWSVLIGLCQYLAELLASVAFTNHEFPVEHQSLHHYSTVVPCNMGNLMSSTDLKFRMDKFGHVELWFYNSPSFFIPHYHITSDLPYSNTVEPMEY